MADLQTKIINVIIQTMNLYERNSGKIYFDEMNHWTIQRGDSLAEWNIYTE